MEPLAPLPLKDVQPIHTPVSLYWREFRVQFLPPIVLVASIITVYFLFRFGSHRSTVPGMGEGVRSVITSPQPGVLQDVLVTPYETVEAGQVLAILQPVDARAQMDMFQAEVQLARLRLEPSMAEDHALNFERIRLELLRHERDFAVAQVNFARADNEVRRTRPLFEKKLVAEDLFDLSLKTREAYLAEMTATSNAIALITGRLEELKYLGEPSLRNQTNSVDSPMIARLEEMRAANATNWVPMKLVSPISGMVTSIIRHKGENVENGDILITVNGVWSDRIVGYIRQPYAVEPRVGTPVTVTTRDRRRMRFKTEIAQVGAQHEVITNALASVREGILVDSGLPIVIHLPTGRDIRPGEIVDLLIQPDSERTGEGTAQQRARFEGKP